MSYFECYGLVMIAPNEPNIQKAHVGLNHLLTQAVFNPIKLSGKITPDGIMQNFMTNFHIDIIKSSI